jgi:hypothetical protein
MSVFNELLHALAGFVLSATLLAVVILMSSL